MNPPDFLDDLLKEIRQTDAAAQRRTHNPIAKAALAAIDDLLSAGWNATGLRVRSHWQHCACCGASAEHRSGLFLEELGPRGVRRLTRAKESRTDLPLSFESTEEAVNMCASCLRIEHELENWVEGRHQPLPRQLKLEI